MIEIRQVETSVNLLKYYMKKVHFILWFIQAVLFSTVVEAAPIDHKEAIRIADKFMFSNREEARMNLTIVTRSFYGIGTKKKMSGGWPVSITQS